MRARREEDPVEDHHIFRPADLAQFQDGVESFGQLSSWAAFDPGANGVGNDPDGYVGGAFDGRYVYFAPIYYGTDYHGEVLRYDTTQDFSIASSWSTFEP